MSARVGYAAQVHANCAEFHPGLYIKARNQLHPSPDNGSALIEAVVDDNVKTTIITSRGTYQEPSPIRHAESREFLSHT